MKQKAQQIKSTLLFLMITLSFLGLSSCRKDRPIITVAPTELTYRTLAWNYLEERSKNTVIENWQEALVFDIELEGKKVKAVMFKTTQDALLGPIIVYISIETNKVIGIGPRF